MTERSFLKTEVLKSLSEKLKPLDFKLTKSDLSFTKKTEFGWNKYMMTFLLTDKGWAIKPGLLMRFDIVENLFHRVSNFEDKYQKGTPTIGTSIEDLNVEGVQSVFDLYEEKQIDIVVDELLDIFNSVALPFFEKYNNLKAVDVQINKDVDSTYLTGPIFKGTKGLILAKLRNREDFESLQSKYQHYYENFSKGFYLPEYERLKKLLSKSE